MPFDLEADVGSAFDNGVADAFLFKLDGGVALAADQELALMRMLRVVATDKGVKRGDTVHQAIFQQEIQRTVNGRRRGAAAVLLAEDAKNVVRAQRLMALPHQLQHPATQGGEAQAFLRAQGVGL